MLEKDRLSPNRYEYLNQRDSDLYDSFKDVNEFQARMIILLLEEKAEASRQAHCNSRY